MLIGWGSNFDFNSINSIEALSAIILWIMGLLAFVVVIFAFLILRQSRRMAEILPTPITPLVKIISWGYFIFSIIVLGLVVNFLVLP